jgi:hypothetical protein
MMCKDVGGKDTAWGMSQSDIAKGFENPKSDGEGGVLETRQPYGSNPQSIGTNEWDRQGPYSREHSGTGVYDGTGTTRNTTGAKTRPVT